MLVSNLEGILGNITWKESEHLQNWDSSFESTLDGKSQIECLYLGKFASYLVNFNKRGAWSLKVHWKSIPREILLAKNFFDILLKLESVKSTRNYGHPMDSESSQLATQLVIGEGLKWCWVWSHDPCVIISTHPIEVVVKVWISAVHKYHQVIGPFQTTTINIMSMPMCTMHMGFCW